MRLCLAAIMIALPGVAFANCSTAVMKMCVITPVNTASIYEEPCAYTQCATNDSVFEYLQFGDGSYARADFDGPETGRLEAKLRFATESNDTQEYKDLPVNIFTTDEGELAIGLGDEGFISTRPCGQACAGINADEFGR
jgi:hypothetical protein